MVIVTSNESNPIRSVGSSVKLICTVKLTPIVQNDITVTVNTSWTGPNRFMANNSMESHCLLEMEGNSNTESDVCVYGNDNFIYTSRAIVTSFTSNKSGLYNCTATVMAQHPNLTNIYTALANGTRFTTG